MAAQATVDAESGFILDNLHSLDGFQDLAVALKVPQICMHVAFEDHERTISLAGLNPESLTIPTPHLNRFSRTTADDEDGDTSEPTGEAAKTLDDGDAMFEIASLAKLFISLLICMLTLGYGNIGGLSDELSLDSSVYELLNKARRLHGKSLVPKLCGNPTVRDVILHLNGLPPKKTFLRSYDGIFMPSKEEFLQNAAKWPKESPDEISDAYSTCNYLLLQLLVEELRNQRICDVVRELILRPLGLINTSMDPEELKSWPREGQLVQGYQVSADCKTIEPVHHQAPMSEMEAVAFRTRSCTNDMAKLILQLVKAFHGDTGGYFSPELANLFFSDMPSKDGGPSRSFAGFRGALNSELPGSDSLNYYSRPEGTKPSYRLGKSQIYGANNESKPMTGGLRTRIHSIFRRTNRESRNVDRANEEQGGEIFVHYKGGTIDGFTSSIYIAPRHRMFVIALSNATAPLDLTDCCCQAILQDVFVLYRPCDSIARSIAEHELPTAIDMLLECERADKEVPDLSTPIGQFVGRYQHNHDGFEIEVTENGKLIRHGRERAVTSTMRVRNVNGELKVYPDVNSTFCIDRRSDFKNAAFVLQKDISRVMLCDRNDGRYTKIR